MRDKFLKTDRGLLEHLQNLVNIKWLSIHRSELSRMIREERGLESTVDKKLSELSNDFIKYFSSLTKLGETEKFQKFFFLSLIPKENEFESSLKSSKLNLTDEKKALVEIYEKFNVDKRQYNKLLNQYFEDTENAFDSLEKEKSIKSDQIVNILSAWRIHKVVQQWTELNENLKKIYEPQVTFLTTLNEMLQRKKLLLNDKNELIVETQSGKKFPITQLSSGEKQLIIILGEALLQEKSTWVYIADEPELSLHIGWQEKLITNLRKFNLNSQIIFATHSPDIVSIYNKNVFDMEKHLK